MRTDLKMSGSQISLDELEGGRPVPKSHWMLCYRYVGRKVSDSFVEEEDCILILW